MLKYLKLIAINHIIQLLLKINKWNLKVLISDLLPLVFQFHILFAPLWIWKHAVYTFLHRLKCPLNLSSEQRKVSSEHSEKIRHESFLVRKILDCLV